MKYLLILVLAGCTIAPKEVKRQAIAFDGSTQNAGFLGFSDGRGLITETARLKYNALINLYGSRFLIPLQPDQGLIKTNDCWLIDQEHLVEFQTMSRWHHDGK